MNRNLKKMTSFVLIAAILGSTGIFSAVSASSAPESSESVIAETGTQTMTEALYEEPGSEDRAEPVSEGSDNTAPGLQETEPEEPEKDAAQTMVSGDAAETERMTEAKTETEGESEGETETVSLPEEYEKEERNLPAAEPENNVTEHPVTETDDQTEAGIPAGTEEEKQSETETETESENGPGNEKKSDTENEAESDTESEIESETESETESDAEAETERFMEKAEGADDLNADAFRTARLVVLAESPSTIIDPEHLIASYGKICLLQYGSVEQALNAYLYYLEHADAVEPDQAVETAYDDETEPVNVTLPSEVTGIRVTEEVNPISALSGEADSAAVKGAGRVIALIDTGTSEGPNVIDRISLIDDVLEGNGHGNAMVKAMVSQNPDVEILSVRAVGNDGRGTVSSIVAAVEYAIGQGVDIINLSLYAKSSLSNSVLKSEIQKAASTGILVVGAAGNDGADASGYMPGSVEEAFVIGSCNENGIRLSSSNYGSTVDYYVAANSTSEAAAKFSGYLSLYGTDISGADGLIYESALEPGTADYFIPEPNTADQNLLLTYIMKAYGEERFLPRANETDFAEIYRLSGEEVEQLIKLEEDYWANKELNDYLSVMEETKDTARTNLPEGIWQGEASLTGSSEGGAVIQKPDETDTDAIVPVKLIAGGLAELAANGLETSVPRMEGTWAFDIPEGQTVCDYSWEVQENGTILLTFLPEGCLNSQEDETAGFTIRLLPDDRELRLAEFEGQLFGASEWNVMVGTTGYTLSDAMNFDGKEYADWLTAHSADDYYLGTPYPTGSLAGDSGAYPNGDHDGTTARMNCTAFVWHVLWKAMQNSGNSSTPADYGIGTSRDNTFKGWTTKTRGWDIERGYFTTKKNLFDVGKPQKGDIIWVMGAGEDTLGTTTVDNHVMIYMGNGSTDIAWHSSHGQGWCDGTNDGNSLDGHWVSLTLNGKTLTEGGNAMSEITSKQKATFGYALYRVGAEFEALGNVRLRKDINNPDLAASTSRIKISTEFTIYTNRACTKELSIDGITNPVKIIGNDTQSSKTVTITGIPVGTYYLKETKRCPGCIVNNSIYSFKVEEGKTTSRFTNLDTGIANSYISNTPGRFTGKIAGKVDADTNAGLEGAVFKVIYSEKTRGAEGQEDNYTWYLKSDANGNVYFDEAHCLESFEGNKSDEPIQLTNGTWALPWGYLFVTEVAAPDGYLLTDSTEQTLHFGLSKDSNGEYTISTITATPLTFADEPDQWTVNVNAKKVSALSSDALKSNANYSIAGAEFTVYTNPACTASIGKLTTAADGSTNTLSYTAEGTASSVTLYCKETKASPGHTLNEEIYSLSFSKSEKGITRTFGGTSGIREDYKYTRIQLKKTDASGGWSDSLAGAQFTLYQENAALETITISSGDYHTFSYKCLLGETYTVKETATPDGYITASDITVTVGSESTYQTFYQYTVANVPIPEVQVAKISNAPDDILALSGYTVEGTEFGIYTDINCTDKLTALTTGADGKTPLYRLPCQAEGVYTYYVREDKAPAGHIQNTSVTSFSVTLPTDGGTTKYVNMWDDPEFTTLNALVEKLDNKGNPVPGVVVCAKFYDASDAQSECLKKTWYLISDKQGRISLDNAHLDPGRTSDPFYIWKDQIVIPKGYLTIQEIAAPASYQISDQILSWDTSTPTLSVSMLYNELEPCRIAIRKLDTDGKTPLQGVTFELKFIKASEVLVPDAAKAYSPLLKEGETAQLTTDVQGQALFENLDQGVYQLTEVQTVEGHMLLAEPINITLPITMTEAEAAAKGNIDLSRAKQNIGYDNSYYFFEATFEVTNTSNLKIPTTGGRNDWIPGYAGISLFSMIGFGMMYSGHRKRRRGMIQK